MNIVKHRADSGVHVVAYFTKGRHEMRAWKLGMRSKNTISLHDFAGGEVEPLVVQGLNLADFLIDESCVGNGCNHVSGSSFALGANHCCAFPDASSSFSQAGCTANERDSVVVLVDVEVGVGRG